MNKRPFSIAIIGGFFIGLGTFVIVANVFWLAHGQGLVHGMHEGVGDGTGTSEHSDLLWVFGTQLLAIVAGVFLLRGHNWARWLLVAWLGFHVAMSAFHDWGELAVHSLFAVIVIYFLFRAPASEYFRGAPRPLSE
jgi:hypothetical protein